MNKINKCISVAGFKANEKLPSFETITETRPLKNVARENKFSKTIPPSFGAVQRRSERLPTVHCDCISSKMAEFSLARRVFTVFLCDIFTGLES